MEKEAPLCCAAADECAGHQNDSRLLRDIVEPGVLGDVYCETCWLSHIACHDNPFFAHLYKDAAGHTGETWWVLDPVTPANTGGRRCLRLVNGECAGPFVFGPPGRELKSRRGVQYSPSSSE